MQREGSRERRIKRLEEENAQLAYENGELKRILASIGRKPPRKPAATTIYDRRTNAATG